MRGRQSSPELSAEPVFEAERDFVDVIPVVEVHQVGRRQVVTEDEHVADVDLATLGR